MDTTSRLSATTIASAPFLPSNQALRVLLAMLFFSASQVIALMVLWRFFLIRNTFTLYQYGLVLPALFAVIGALILPDELQIAEEKLSGFKLKCETIILLSLSPFVTWYFLTSNVPYLYYCTALFIYVFYIGIYQLLAFCQTLGGLYNVPALKFVIACTKWFWILFLILPMFVASGCWIILDIFVESTPTRFLELLLATHTPLQKVLFSISFVGLAASAFSLINTAIFAYDHLHSILERQETIITHLLNESSQRSNPDSEDST